MHSQYNKRNVKRPNHFTCYYICDGELSFWNVIVQVEATYDSVTPLLDVIDVIHGRILFAEWSRGCDCCSVHCHVRLHRVDDLRPSRRDDVHEPTFDRRAVERSRMLCFDRQSRMLYIAGSGRIHCVNIWRKVDVV